MTKPEVGELLLNTVWILGRRHIEIERADEHVRIAHALLDIPLHPDVTYGDGILTIKALNGTVSYGIGPYDLRTDTHDATRSGVADPSKAN